VKLIQKRCIETNLYTDDSIIQKAEWACLRMCKRLHQRLLYSLRENKVQFVYSICHGSCSCNSGWADLEVCDKMLEAFRKHEGCGRLSAIHSSVKHRPTYTKLTTLWISLSNDYDFVSLRCSWLVGSLFYDVFSVTRVYSVNDWVISEWWWFGKDLVGSGRGLILRYYSYIGLDGLRKSAKPLHQGIRSPGPRF
jgi:hypothetical protein